MERWLDKKEDDGRISLELEPNKKPASKKDQGLSPVAWILDTHTSDSSDFQ